MKQTIPANQTKLRPSLTLDDLAIIVQSLSITHPGTPIHRTLTGYYHKQVAIAMLSGAELPASLTEASKASNSPITAAQAIQSASALPYPEAMLPESVRAMKDETFGELLALHGAEFLNLPDLEQAKAIDSYLVDSGKVTADIIQYFPLSNTAAAIAKGAAISTLPKASDVISPKSQPDLSDI